MSTSAPAPTPMTEMHVFSPLFEIEGAHKSFSGSVTISNQGEFGYGNLRYIGPPVYVINRRRFKHVWYITAQLWVRYPITSPWRFIKRTFKVFRTLAPTPRRGT